jgi:ABC-type transport system substrate-binding protein
MSAGADGSIRTATRTTSTTPRPNNDGSYSNKDVDQLLDASRQTNDEAQRKDAFRKAEQIYLGDALRDWLDPQFRRRA